MMMADIVRLLSKDFLSRCFGFFLGAGFLAVALSFSPYVHAQGAAQNAARFVPAAAWQVNPVAVPGREGATRIANLPCSLSTEFDNGYVLRMSGANGKIFAMAIDFRQNVFNRGARYPVSVSIDGASPTTISATAFSASTLLINTRTIQSFYSGLNNGNVLNVDVEGNRFGFQMNNIGQALNKLEECVSPGSSVTPVALTGQRQPANTSQASTPQRQSSPSFTPPMRQAYTPARQSSGAVSMPEGQPRRTPPPVFTAQQGAEISVVLDRWARQAGARIDAQAPLAGTVTEDIRLSTDFATAVNQLLSEYSSAGGYAARLEGGASGSGVDGASGPALLSPTYNRPVSRSESSGSNRGASASGAYQAPAGASVESVLKQWSGRNNTRLVWEAGRVFRLKNDIRTDGSFEQALRQVLEQFSGEREKLVGQYNTDPQTGSRVLLVQSTRI